jgi:hypothetical protein
MKVKSLTAGLVMTLAATGALATAPAASAALDQESHQGRVWCSLRAHSFRGDDTGFGRGDHARIRVAFKLRSNGDRDGTNLWKVEIKQNGGQIDATYKLTSHGFLKVVKVARDTYRRDVFKAVATNFRTGQTCRATVYDPGIKF